MSDDALAKILAELEREIGPERLSALRREAARRGVSVLHLLSEAVVDFSNRLTTSAA